MNWGWLGLGMHLRGPPKGGACAGRRWVDHCRRPHSTLARPVRPAGRPFRPWCRPHPVRKPADRRKVHFPDVQLQQTTVFPDIQGGQHGPPSTSKNCSSATRSALSSTGVKQPGAARPSRRFKSAFSSGLSGRPPARLGRRDPSNMDFLVGQKPSQHAQFYDWNANDSGRQPWPA